MSLLRRRPVTRAPGVIPTALRHCPNEQRTRTVYTHPDGTATCDHCHAHIERTTP
ncbi:hypothetical protein [Streptomyces sp. NPDC020983]|uniref:hypothetical protein n=1 Tax=Streptomyces sp. NPDC020983 TaxID=3365106 RepID=UPI0037B92A76